MIRLSLTLGLAAVGLAAVVSLAGIEGSAHDFSPFGWSRGEICLPCHTPHGADTTISDAPLWNHELTTATYTLYDGSQGGVIDLDSRSVLCMSCHDGTIALDSFGGHTGMMYIGPAGLIGTDLREDHPIGRTGVYPNVPWFNDPANWENQPHGFTLHDMEVDGQMRRVVSCATCHEVHNRHGHDYMLRVSNAGSALCLTCHLK